MTTTGEKVYLVSACLLGIDCRYNGFSKKDERVIGWAHGKRVVPVCPESLSGLPIPRDPAEFDEGDGTMLRSGRSRLVTREGVDVSKAMLRGATEALKIARLVGATDAVLKDRSPSCGVYEVYNQAELVAGIGCFTALLLMEGVAVRSEKDLGGS
jgi:uncharacterized protein YbbK (DUF523 family)